MSAHGSRDEKTHPLLRQRRRAEHFASTYLQASVRKIPEVKKHAVAATLALVLLVVTAKAFLFSEDRTPGARPLHDFGNQDDASLLLAKATGMTNSDEAKSLLKALQDGTLDFGTVSSALEEDAAREKAKIKAEVEKEASRKAAEEKAAAEKAAAEKVAAEKAAAEKAAADKAAAEKAAADKAAADKAAAERASLTMHKAVPQSFVDVFFENDDDYYDEDDWLEDELEDETDDGVDDLALSRREQKRSVSLNSQGGGRAPSIKGKDRAQGASSWRNKVDRKGHPSLSDDTGGEEEDDWLEDEFEDEIDDGDSPTFPRREQRPSALFNSQGGGRAPSRKGKGRAQGASSWRNKVDRKGHPSLSDDTGGEEEDDWLGDELDEIDDGVSPAFSRREQKRSVNFINRQGGRRSTSKKENHRVPNTQSLRVRLNPKKSPYIFEQKEEEKGPERRDDDDEEYYGKKQRGKLSPLSINQKPNHSPLTHPQATTAARRQAPKGGAGQQRGGVRRAGGGRRGVPRRLSERPGA